MGASGVAVSALQPQGATDLAAGAAVWMAITRLPLTTGVAVARPSSWGRPRRGRTGSPAAVLAATLLGVLLGLVAYLMRQGREAQDRTELLLAQLADARDAQAQAAAVAERGRIAAELHDVLAHALSGAAIQLQGARLLADREQASSIWARPSSGPASSSPTGWSTPARPSAPCAGSSRTPSLISRRSWRRAPRHEPRHHLEVEGTVPELPPQTGLALYRAVQEAVTNAARYAPAPPSASRCRYGPGMTTMRVQNTAAHAPMPGRRRACPASAAATDWSDSANASNMPAAPCTPAPPDAAGWSR